MRTKGAISYSLSLVAAVILALLMTAAVTRAAGPKKPNILILWGDDIGWNDFNCYDSTI